MGGGLQSRLAQALATAVAVFAAVLALSALGALERAELAAYDLGLRARPQAPLDARLVIIDETEEDLKRFGHPLSDEVLARIVESALALEPRVLGVDKFRDIPVAPGSDALERVVAARRNVYWIYQFGGNGTRRIPAPRWLARPAQAGFVDILVDPGGTVRRGLLYLDDGGPPRRSFALTLALAYLARDGIGEKPDPANSDLLRLGATTFVPLQPSDGGYSGADASGYQMLLDYRGAPATFARVTVGELLDGRVDPALLRDRIAIVGSSADSLKDFFNTPFSRRGAEFTTGAEVLAHQASQLVRLAKGESFPVRTLPRTAEALLLALFCALGLAAWLATRAKQLGGLALGGLGALLLAWYACAAAGVWLPVTSLALGFVLTTFASAGLRALQEARERAALMAIFSRHVAPEVARELWERRDEVAEGQRLRPKRLEATVLFADLHGYTPVAARLAPEETARWLNQFMEPMAEIIMAHRGVIRQYAGDAIMAIFGAPLPAETREECERDARTSVACARAMCRRFAELNETWRRAGMPTAGLRIGIYSGPMVGCNIGSRRRLEYAVVGDAVNVAARLQTLALPEGDEGESGRILIGEETRVLLPINEPCERVGSFVLKGRSEPMSVYRVAA
jgi:adenylate cyclase